MQEISTKEKILVSALKLFAKNGYDGTLLRDIAADVGICKSALYKHYASKEDIWNNLVLSIERYYSENMSKSKEKDLPETLEELKNLSLKQIEFTINDERIKTVRKLLTVEQFRNKTACLLADNHFVNDIEKIYTRIFEHLVNKGVVKGVPEILSFEYTAPITVMIHKCDRNENEKTQILCKIVRHIDNYLNLISK